MKAKQVIIPIIFLGLVVVGSLVGVYLVRQQQLVEPKAVVPSGGAAEMSLSPSSKAVESGEEFDVSVNFMVDGGVKISGITADIKFTADKDSPPFNISNPSTNTTLIDQGWRYQKHETSISGDTTTISIIAVHAEGFSAPIGQQISLATINFEGNVPGEIEPIIESTFSEVTLLETGEDTLKPPTNNYAYTVSGEAPDPTNTPIPTAEPTAEPTNTPNTTITPEPTSSGGGGSDDDGFTKRDIQVTNVTNGQTLTDTTPTFTGTATDDSDIDIDITKDSDSSSVTGFTTANSSGDWTWTSTTALSGGNYTGTFISTDRDGDESSISVTFIISTTTGSTELPDAGNTTTTLAILSMGILLIISGAGFSLLKRP